MGTGRAREGSVGVPLVRGASGSGESERGGREKAARMRREGEAWEPVGREAKVKASEGRLE